MMKKNYKQICEVFRNKLYLLICMVFLFTLISVNAGMFYKLSLSNIDNTLTFSSIEVVDIQTPREETIGKYFVETIDINGKEISKTNFDLPQYGGFSVFAPYNKETVQISIKDLSRRELFKISTAAYADTCNNKICEEYESYETCPLDCKSGGKDDYCDELKDNVCDPDCSVNSNFDADCKGITVGAVAEKKDDKLIEGPIKKTQEKEVVAPEDGGKLSISTIILYIFIILLIVGVLFLIIMKLERGKHTEKGKEDSTIRRYILQNISKGHSMHDIRKALIDNGYDAHEVDRLINQIR